MTKEKLNRYLQFLNQDPNNVSLLIEIYTLYHELGEQHLAQTILAQTKTVLTPLESIDAKLLLARLLQRQGQLEEALALVNQILKINPENCQALGLTAFLLFDLNKEKQAEGFVKKVLNLEPNNYEGNCIDILLRLKSQETTIEEIKVLLSKHPKDSRMLFALGNTYMNQGKMDLAEEALQQAISLHPNFYHCLILLAFCQVLTEKLDKAQANYYKATEAAKELSEGWSGLALVKVLRGEIDEARPLIDKAKALNADCIFVNMTETIYFSYKNPKKAKDQLVCSLEEIKKALVL